MHKWNAYLMVVVSGIGLLGYLFGYGYHPVIAGCMGYALGSALMLGLKFIWISEEGK